ncbi:E3 ubiquitin-protein ligase RBBP6 [Toxocara canis]|uniref:E3 ubiquitin-protein ligase RBBP6 n=1 Tax=Toxocara canis TaxID=6265 RepID=A0A0B2UNY4_TOXCA|nr:E3 ubiquitin-protein ligase RBBP6 [Toxocara canis]
MSSIHYKFKATLEYKTLTFNGLHISVSDLKKEICEKENIKTESFDLILTNAHTKRQYAADEFIPRNSSVVVQRTPRDNAAKLPKVQDSTNSGAVSKGAMPDGAFTSHMESEQFNQLTEEERIAHIKEVSAFKYQPSNFQKKSSSILWGPPPPTYQCNRCSQSGHWYKNCPMLNTRRTTGITMDELMETTADDPLAMLHPSGKFVVPIMHWKARQQKKTELSRAPEPDNRVIPPELRCPLCSQLLRDAVLTTCCGDSFCAECVQQRLLESVNAKCPGANCIQTSISADKIVPNLKVRQAVEAFKKAAPSAQSGTSGTQQAPVLQQPPADATALVEEPPKVQAQPVPRVRIGLGSRLQPAQPLTTSAQQNTAPPQQQQQPQPSSSSLTLQGAELNNLVGMQQTIRPPLSQQQAQPQSQPPPLPPQPQPMVAGMVLAPGPPPIESPKMPTTVALPAVPPPAVTAVLLPVASVLPVNVHQPPPGYTPVTTSAQPTASIASSTKTTASTDNRGVAAMLPSMSAPPPPIIVHQPPLQPPPPGLSAATTFPSVPAPPPVRDAWDEFIERKEKVFHSEHEMDDHDIQQREAVKTKKYGNECYSEQEGKHCCFVAKQPRQRLGFFVPERRIDHNRLFVATQASRRRHSSPSDSYSSSESSSESSSDSRSRSRSWSRERNRRERRHGSRERRHSRRVESRSPPRLYSGPPSRYHRDSGPSHNIYQHPPPAPLNASPTTYPHHRIPPLITYPPPPFLPVPNASLSGFQPLPAGMLSSGAYRGGRGYDERAQRRRSPRAPEADRRVTRSGGTSRERESERRERIRIDESRRRPRDNEDRSARVEERPVKNKPREANERDQRRNKYREGTSRRHRERTETKTAEAHPAANQPEKPSKKEIKASGGENTKGRAEHGASTAVAKEDGTVNKKVETVEEEEMVGREVVDKEGEAAANEELGTGSDVLIEKEDENQTIDVGGVEAREPELEGVETTLVEGTEGSVSGADAENEDGTEAMAESGERERSEKKKKRKKKKKHKKESRSEGEHERKKHHKQHREEFTGEERDAHKKGKKHKRSREEKERHKEEKERRREEKKRRKERQEESADANDVGINAVREIGAESHVLEKGGESKEEYGKDCGGLTEVLCETGKPIVRQAEVVVSEEGGEKEKLRESTKDEQKPEECGVSEGGRKSIRTEERMKGVKRVRQGSWEEGGEEKRSRPSGTNGKRDVERRATDEQEEKKDSKRDHYGTNESRRRDEKHSRGADSQSRSERSTRWTGSGLGHQQSVKRRAEGRDESKERKETKVRRDDEGVRGKQTRCELRRDAEREPNAEESSEDRRCGKRKSGVGHDDPKKIREGAVSNIKRCEEKHRESKNKEEDLVEKEKEKEKREKKGGESTARVEKRDETNKMKNVNKEESVEKSDHRRERDDSKSSGKEKKLDDIKVSIENELAGERKVDTPTSGDSQRDKPNITVELKYGGEKKVTRENVFENSVPQFNARQKIKMILLSESERFAADKAKKRNVK